MAEKLRDIVFENGVPEPDPVTAVPFRKSDTTGRPTLSSVPNPFVISTTIRYEVPPGSNRVRLRVMNAAGRVVRTLVNARSGDGRRTVVWDARDDSGDRVAVGVYFFRLEARDHAVTHRVVHLQ
jgi:flagellar hook assembly protein FlgD